MRAGKLDRVVTVLRRTETGRTALNEPIFEWPAAETVRAQLIHRSEDEAFAASQRYEKRLVTFRTRWIPNLSAVDRLECDGLTYEIRGIRELGRRAGLDVAAEVQI